ncbi:MAG: nucleotidyl transferase AbiEii/AbiGii toxin family protein [Francisellaceae bacterium]|nr:nucleotidyl transferase AbiEii/AbiGii toxin family protein [Francisellaceae bacterium]
MHDTVKQMLKKYQCQSQQDYLNALKEIFQEIALLGLWRAKFFENAAFYGGSALRILYGLDRFSEDLDFSLLDKNLSFNLDPYNKAITKELEAFGFVATVDTKIKQSRSDIKSAFIKAESKTQLITIQAPNDIIKSMHHMQTMKIKMEVDANPPGSFNTDTKFLLLPIPFSVKSFTEADLFAGKIHALLCRPWVSRIKGRDWYDFVWYISRNIPVNLLHLQARLVQSDAWNELDTLHQRDLLNLLTQKIKTIDFSKAKDDIAPFIKDAASIDVWSKDFSQAILKKLKAV